MPGWEYDLDRYLTTPPEPKVVGKCANCDAELYANCNYVHDRNENEWFCDFDCYLDKLREAGDIVDEEITN